jgi:hypothetical protein
MSIDRAFWRYGGVVGRDETWLHPKKPDRAKLNGIMEKNKRPTGPAQGFSSPWTVVGRALRRKSLQADAECR